MFVHFTIYNTKHNPPKSIKYIVQSSVFLLLWGVKMQIKMNFMVLEIWLFGFGKFGKVSEIFLRRLYESCVYILRF